jgi:hypothetical protein
VGGELGAERCSLEWPRCGVSQTSWAVHGVIQDTLSEVSRVSITLTKLFERGTYGNETHCSCFCAVRAVVEAFDQDNIGVTE